MTIPLAYITWGGVDQHMEVQLTVVHGTEPSRVTINIPPTPEIAVSGTLAFRQGSTIINFYDCRADIVDVYKDESGLEMWTVTIMDRRWRWRFGQISGYYNIRVDKTLRKGTEKNIKDLMKLCLEEMGEKNYDLSTVPTDIFPEVDWNYVLPSEALSQLASLIGFRVVFQVRRDRVAILKHGEGRTLKQEDATNYATTFDPPETPTELRFVGGRTFWEMHLLLEAVAQETQKGEFGWKLLDDRSLSYRPKDGWFEYDPDFANIIGNEKVSLLAGELSLRKFVQANVFKKYRITPFVLVSEKPYRTKLLTLQHPDGKKLVVEERQQLLPLLHERLATYKTEFGDRAKPSVIWGKFEGGGAAYDNNVEDRPVNSSSGGPDWLPDGSPPKHMVYPHSWNLDADTGIVSFSDPVFNYVSSRIQYTRVDGTIYALQKMGYVPATLWLRVGFGFRDKKTRAWKSWEVPRVLDKKAKTKPQFVHRDDVPLSLVISNDGKIIDVKNATKKEYSDAAKFYLDETQKTLQTKDPVAVTYPYLRMEDLDGAVQQVTWMVTARGGFTKVSRNREELIVGYTYAEQRFFQQAVSRLGASPTARAVMDRAARIPGKG